MATTVIPTTTPTKKPNIKEVLDSQNTPIISSVLKSIGGEQKTTAEVINSAANSVGPKAVLDKINKLPEEVKGALKVDLQGSSNAKEVIPPSTPDGFLPDYSKNPIKPSENGRKVIDTGYMQYRKNEIAAGRTPGDFKSYSENKWNKENPQNPITTSVGIQTVQTPSEVGVQTGQMPTTQANTQMPLQLKEYSSVELEQARLTDPVKYQDMLNHNASVAQAKIHEIERGNMPSQGTGTYTASGQKADIIQGTAEDKRQLELMGILGESNKASLAEQTAEKNRQNDVKLRQMQIDSDKNLTSMKIEADRISANEKFGYDKSLAELGRSWQALENQKDRNATLDLENTKTQNQSTLNLQANPGSYTKDQKDAIMSVAKDIDNDATVKDVNSLGSSVKDVKSVILGNSLDELNNQFVAAIGRTTTDETTKSLTEKYASGKLSPINKEIVFRQLLNNGNPDIVKRYTDNFGYIVDMGTRKMNQTQAMKLIFAYSKALDPASVVREGEYDRFTNAQSLPEKVTRLFKKGTMEPDPILVNRQSKEIFDEMIRSSDAKTQQANSIISQKVSTLKNVYGLTDAQALAAIPYKTPGFNYTY